MDSSFSGTPAPSEFSAGDDITRKSFSIIRGRLAALDGWRSASREVEAVVVRIAHTTGDVQFATTFEFSAGAVGAGVAAIRAGMPIVVDVGMVRQGIRARHLPEPASPILCGLDDPETAALAAREGMTRSAAAMRLAADRLNGAVIAIGNAPTALFEVMALARAGIIRPALVIGVPVGFVGAFESKAELHDSGLTHITNLSERGGSPIAAAIVNGLIALASGRGDL